MSAIIEHISAEDDVFSEGKIGKYADLDEMRWYADWW
jgi:hypothetical protein